MGSARSSIAVRSAARLVVGLRSNISAPLNAYASSNTCGTNMTGASWSCGTGPSASVHATSANPGGRELSATAALSRRYSGP